MKPETVLAIVNDVREQFQREEDQGLMQDDMDKAKLALAGKWACDRIARALSARAGVPLVFQHDAGRAG